MMTTQPTQTVQDRLAALEAAAIAFGEAWATGDLGTLDRLLSPTYMHHDAHGARFDRAAWLDYAARRTGRATIIEFRDVDYRLFGDIAVVTGTIAMRGGGVRSEEDPRDMVIVFTQVWVWRDGRWLRESFQATPVIDEGFG